MTADREGRDPRVVAHPLECAVHLDLPPSYGSVDRSDQRALLARFPMQARDAWELGREWAIPPHLTSPERVVVFGMGASAAGADIIATLAAASSPVPVEVIRGYSCPAIDERTLAVACSFSGNTEETLAAFAEARTHTPMTLAISTGGLLLADAEVHNDAAVHYEWPGAPRTALGYALFPLLGILQRLDVVRTADSEIEQALETLDCDAVQWQPDTPARDNLAKQLASRLFERLPVLLGAGHLGVVASRWAAQLNENSKQWALAAPLPEANHNLIVGFESPEWLRASAHVLLLDAPTIHQRDRLRVRLTADLLAEAGVSREIVETGGDSPLATMLVATHLGDWVSYYLALLRGIDPTPVPEIDRLKEQLRG